MPRSPGSVFLERNSYRRRRMMDALRLVAVFGIVLWMIPIIWPDGASPDSHPVSMSHALFYVFGVWVALIVLSGMLAVQQRDGKGTTKQDMQEPDDGT